MNIKNPWDAKNRLEQDGVHTMDVIDNLGRSRGMTIINEGNLNM
jgi:hypothetical protein